MLLLILKTESALCMLWSKAVFMIKFKLKYTTYLPFILINYQNQFKVYDNVSAEESGLVTLLQR